MTSERAKILFVSSRFQDWSSLVIQGLKIEPCTAPTKETYDIEDLYIYLIKSICFSALLETATRQLTGETALS